MREHPSASLTRVFYRSRPDYVDTDAKAYFCNAASICALVARILTLSVEDDLMVDAHLWSNLCSKALLITDQSEQSSRTTGVGPTALSAWGYQAMITMLENLCSDEHCVID